MKRLLVPVAGLAMIGTGFAAGIAVSSAAADDPAPVTVTRQSLAERAAPTGAPNRTLGLSRVVVMPGAKLPSHHHPGSQLGYVAEGVLTYTVETGRATLLRGPGDDPKVIRRINPGQTVRVRPGQWLREEQGEVHHASNAGSTPIVIYLATLLKTGKPAAIAD